MFTLGKSIKDTQQVLICNIMGKLLTMSGWYSPDFSHWHILVTSLLRSSYS